MTQAAHPRISKREASILELAASGKTDKQIAFELGLSVGTVRTYWGRIRVKFSAMTRAQAVGNFVRLRSATLVPEPKGSAASDLLARLALDWGTAAWRVEPSTRSMKPLTTSTTAWLQKRGLGPQPKGVCWSRDFGGRATATVVDFENRLANREAVADWYPAPADGLQGLLLLGSGDADGSYYVLAVPSTPR